MSHHPTPRESHLAHEDSRNEAAQRLRDATRLVEAREEIDRLREALERYGDHDRSCRSRLGVGCSCGFAKAALHPGES